MADDELPAADRVRCLGYGDEFSDIEFLGDLDRIHEEHVQLLANAADHANCFAKINLAWPGG